MQSYPSKCILKLFDFKLRFNNKRPEKSQKIICSPLLLFDIKTIRNLKIVANQSNSKLDGMRPNRLKLTVLSISLKIGQNMPILFKIERNLFRFTQNWTECANFQFKVRRITSFYSKLTVLSIIHSKLFDAQALII